MSKPISFRQRLRELLWDREITASKFEADTGISRQILYIDRKTHRSMLMALAYYFGITVEELVSGTTLEDRII